jgi:hypothetical protein
MFIWPERKKRYYDPNDANVTVELSHCSRQLKNGKFRKYTGPVDKVLAKIQKWLEENKV